MGDRDAGWTLRPPVPEDVGAIAGVLTAAGVVAWSGFLGAERNERARRFYERHGWREEGPPRVRDWHGARLREPRYVRDL
jgi:hypothetical protein